VSSVQIQSVLHSTQYTITIKLCPWEAQACTLLSAWSKTTVKYAYYDATYRTKQDTAPRKTASIMTAACDDWGGPGAQILFLLLKFMVIHRQTTYFVTWKNSGRYHVTIWYRMTFERTELLYEK